MNSHQGKFQPFYKYAKNFNSDDFDYEGLVNSDYIFMRWKVSIYYLTTTSHLFILLLALNSNHDLFFSPLRSSS